MLSDILLKLYFYFGGWCSEETFLSVNDKEHEHSVERNFTYMFLHLLAEFVPHSNLILQARVPCEYSFKKFRQGSKTNVNISRKKKGPFLQAYSKAVTFCSGQPQSSLTAASLSGSVSIFPVLNSDFQILWLNSLHHERRSLQRCGEVKIF